MRQSATSLAPDGHHGFADRDHSYLVRETADRSSALAGDEHRGVEQRRCGGGAQSSTSVSPASLLSSRVRSGYAARVCNSRLRFGPDSQRARRMDMSQRMRSPTRQAAAVRGVRGLTSSARSHRSVIGGARVPSPAIDRTACVAESIEQLSFELTAGALAEQERALSGLRARAGTVLAAASIAGSFFGAKTSHGSLGAWGVLAMASFALGIGSAIRVLLPHELVFAFHGETLLADGDHHGVSNVMEAYRTAGIWIEPHLGVNRDKIAGLSRWLSLSCALLAVEIVLWTISHIG